MHEGIDEGTAREALLDLSAEITLLDRTFLRWLFGRTDQATFESLFKARIDFRELFDIETAEGTRTVSDWYEISPPEVPEKLEHLFDLVDLETDERIERR